MPSEIKQSYLDKLVRKPMPKSVHQFLTITTPENKNKNTEQSNEIEEGEIPETPSSNITIVDKRRSVKINCESVWEKINRRVGSVFDKRKTHKERGTNVHVTERFTSSYLENLLGKRAKATGKKGVRFDLEEEPEVEAETETAPEEEREPQLEKETAPEPEPEPVSIPATEEEPAPETFDFDIEELEEPPEPVVRVPKKRKEKQPKEAEQEMTVSDKAMINGRPIAQRLPKPDKIVMKVPAYYMTNRKMYMQKLSELFKDYNKEIADEVANASCERQASEDFQLLIHQRIVRDYLNIYTPYRGLLLYHGLGSGKTCTSIAIAEGMKSHRKIFVMTPASLKMNFFSELKKCGDLMYKKKQYWEFITIEGQPQNVQILSKSLSLPVDFILKHKGAWLMDVSKPGSNYSELSGDEQRVLDAQLNAMIRTKYVDINYNGINDARYQKLTEQETINPFDNATVLIDEAHNFVSRISNKLKAPKSISYKLYQLLLDADNVRIILMTGTPMINYPNELGILYNILRGRIRTWTFTITENQRLVKDNIVDMFDTAGLKTYDYIDYANGKLEITRNPFGFVNLSTGTKKTAAQRGGTIPEKMVVEVIPSNKNTLEIMEIEDEKEPADEIHDEPKSEIDGGKPKHKGTLRLKIKEQTKKQVNNKTKKRVSNVKNAELSNSNRQETAVEEIEIPEEINATVEQQVQMELQQYANNMGDPHKGGDAIVNKAYNGVYLNEQGNISDATFLSEVKRILRQNNIAFDENVQVKAYTALPDDAETFLQMFVEDSTLTVKNVNLFKKRILGLTSYFRSAQEKLLPSFELNDKNEIYNIVPIEMSDYQIKNYFRIRTDEAKREKNMRLIQASSRELYSTASSYRIFSRSACNFIFPPDITRPLPDPAKTKKQTSEEELDNIVDTNTEDMYMDENAGARIEDREYNERIRMTLTQLAKVDETTGKSPYLSREGLQKLSPKFLRMLENLETPENRGLHLVYSNFRSLEGVGIFKMVLEANGFAEFKLQRNGDVWEIKDTDPDTTKPRFVLYTGTETNDEKEIIRNIYNSQWELVPASIVAKLREKAENNFYGEIVKIIMITASGAEGINLANTRFVHIMEPYWHMVRIDQVIGRARRICSHKNLPEELRTVKVFLYVSVFSESQKINRDYKDLMINDISRHTSKPITTDEALYDIALLKDNINSQLLKSIKETAIDCRLYKKGNASENLVCYGEGISLKTNDFGIFPSIEEDRVVREDINVREKTRKLRKMTVKGPDGTEKSYAKFGTSNDLYDWDAYSNSEQEILVGRYEPKSKKILLV